MQGLGNYKPQGSDYAYLEAPGNYLLEIGTVQEKKTRNKGDAFTVNFNVLESDHPSIRVHEERSWYQSLRDRDVGYPAVLAFYIAAVGCSEDELRPYVDLLSNLATSASNVLSGRVVRCRCTVKMTKVSNYTKPFTLHNWTPYDYPAGQAPPGLAELLRTPVIQAPPGLPAPPPAQAKPWDAYPAAYHRNNPATGAPEWYNGTAWVPKW